MNEGLVKQYSIDIDDDGTTEEEIATFLEERGVVVRGITWKATWTSDGYDKCETPIASD